MVKRIRRAAVLGSGVMGSGIAAHLANVGIPTLLLDIVPRELTKEEEAKGLTLEHKEVRNRLVNQALQKLLKQKPAPLMSKANLSLIRWGRYWPWNKRISFAKLNVTMTRRWCFAHSPGEKHKKEIMPSS